MSTDNTSGSEARTFVDPEQKFDNPARLAELRPAETLQRIGLASDGVLCDIGAGTGVFTLPAAAITHNAVYALDVSDDMLSIIARKSELAGATNIYRVKVTEAGFNVAPGVADIVLMCSMLHGIPNQTQFLADATALLKPDGRIAVIEFHKRETPMGPPPDRRMSRDELLQTANAAGLSQVEAFDLGENFYCAVFMK